MPDRLAGKAGSTDSGLLFNITPNDSSDLSDVTRMLIVGTGGNVKITDSDGAEGTFALAAGQYPVRIKRLWATGTTASGLVGIK